MSTLSIVVPENSFSADYTEATNETVWYTSIAKVNSSYVYGSKVVLNGTFGALNVENTGEMKYIKYGTFDALTKSVKNPEDSFVVIKRNDTEILDTISVVVTFESSAVSTISGLYSVTTEDEFIAALSAEDASIISLANDITLTQTVEGTTSAIINGNGFSFLIDKDGPGISLIGVEGKVTKLIDVKVEKISEQKAGWDSGYNIKLYNGAFEFTNYTSIGNQAALIVNSSTCTMYGNTTISDIVYGGIEASQSSNTSLPTSTLTIAGPVYYTGETLSTPVAWICNDGSEIVGLNYKMELVVDNKTHYYLEEYNTTEEETAEEEAAVEETAVE